jgi:hypothetical protein
MATEKVAESSSGRGMNQKTMSERGAGRKGLSVLPYTCDRISKKRYDRASKGRDNNQIKVSAMNISLSKIRISPDLTIELASS